jgi:hypothetical protein
VKNDEEPPFSEAVMELAQCGGLPLRILDIHERGPGGTCGPSELHDGPTPYPLPPQAGRAACARGPGQGEIAAQRWTGAADRGAAGLLCALDLTHAR